VPIYLRVSKALPKPGAKTIESDILSGRIAAQLEDQLLEQMPDEHDPMVANILKAPAIFCVRGSFALREYLKNSTDNGAGQIDVYVSIDIEKNEITCAVIDSGSGFSESFLEARGFFLVSLQKDAGLAADIIQAAQHTSRSVLIKQGDEFSIYGYRDGQWRYLKLNKLAADEQKILQGLDFTKSLYHYSDFDGSLLEKLKSGHTRQKQMMDYYEHKLKLVDAEHMLARVRSTKIEQRKQGGDNTKIKGGQGLGVASIARTLQTCDGTADIGNVSDLSPTMFDKLKIDRHAHPEGAVLLFRSTLFSPELFARYDTKVYDKDDNNVHYVTYVKGIEYTSDLAQHKFNIDIASPTRSMISVSHSSSSSLNTYISGSASNLFSPQSIGNLNSPESRFSDFSSENYSPMAQECSPSPGSTSSLLYGRNTLFSRLSIKTSGVIPGSTLNAGTNLSPIFSASRESASVNSPSKLSVKTVAFGNDAPSITIDAKTSEINGSTFAESSTPGGPIPLWRPPSLNMDGMMVDASNKQVACDASVSPESSPESKTSMNRQRFMQ
jgi:hypothetical protein